MRRVGERDDRKRACHCRRISARSAARRPARSCRSRNRSKSPPLRARRCAPRPPLHQRPPRSRHGDSSVARRRDCALSSRCGNGARRRRSRSRSRRRRRRASAGTAVRRTRAPRPRGTELRHAELRRRPARRRRRDVGGELEHAFRGVVPRAREAERGILDALDGRLAELRAVRRAKDPRPPALAHRLADHLERRELPARIRLVETEPPAEAVLLVAEPARIELALGELAEPLHGRLVAEILRDEQRRRREARIRDGSTSRLLRIVPAELRDSPRS